MIAAEFARFLGLPVHRRLNTTDIIEAVVGVCTTARTGLVIVDEVHDISLTTRQGAEVSDTLKYFSERIPATFIYAGIDIEHSSILSGTRRAQIAGCFTLLSHQIRGAAIDAILTGTEKITQAELEAIPLDITASTQAPQPRRTTR